MKITIKNICEISIYVALAIVLDNFKIPISLTGGSINLSMVPLVILASRFSLLKSIFSISIIFSILSCLIDGYGFITFPFDYFIAFLGYSSMSIFFKVFYKKDKSITYLLCIILTSIISFIFRMLGHTLSSILIYELDIISALIYNITYVGFSILASTIVLMILYIPLSKFLNYTLKKDKM